MTYLVLWFVLSVWLVGASGMLYWLVTTDKGYMTPQSKQEWRLALAGCSLWFIVIPMFWTLWLGLKTFYYLKDLRQ